MAEGLSVVLPLATSPTDGAYAVHKRLIDTARQSLKMIILTSPGERIMSPNFGVGARRFLFEQMSTGTSSVIAGKVVDQLETYLPYINLEELDVQDLPDENFIRIKIAYSIPASGITDEFVFPITQ